MIDIEWFLFLTMIFAHIIDDYNLQGWLASAKQKSWWENNAPEKLYKHDYIMALLMHSLSWSFLIMLPLAYYQKFNISLTFCMAFLINAFIHMFVDDLKANRKTISLIIDQVLHLAQIVITAAVFLVR